MVKSRKSKSGAIKLGKGRSVYLKAVGGRKLKVRVASGCRGSMWRKKGTRLLNGRKGVLKQAVRVRRSQLTTSKIGNTRRSTRCTKGKRRKGVRKYAK